MSEEQTPKKGRKSLTKEQKNQALKERTGLNINFPDWGKHGPKMTIKNLGAMFDFAGVTVRYNVIKKDIEITIPQLKFVTDNEKNDKMAWIANQVNLLGMPYTRLEEFVAFIASLNAYNPVVDWIKTREWDGEDRIQALCDTVRAVDEHDPKVRGFKETLIKRWLYSCIALACEPQGFPAAGVLIFSGKQGVGKTHWVKKLAPKEMKLVKDGLTLDPKDKDSVYQAVTYWIVELGEIGSTFKKADVDVLKAFLTKEADLLRLPYRREPSNFARRTAFFGSVNDREFLSDKSGNRRFWIIEIDSLDHHHNIDTQQLWAQVYHEYTTRGASIAYLTDPELDELNRQNEMFVSEDPFEVFVREKYRAPQGDEGIVLNATEIAKAMGYQHPTQRETRNVSHAVTKVLGVKNKNYAGNLRGFKLCIVDNNGGLSKEDTTQHNPF